MISVSDGNIYNLSINGINEFYKGVEMDVIYKLWKKIIFELFGVFCDWIYIFGLIVFIFDNSGMLVDFVDFSVKGVYVGNVLQN